MAKWISFVLLHFISQARVILQHHRSDATLFTPITAASAGHLSGGTLPTGHSTAAGRLNPLIFFFLEYEWLNERTIVQFKWASIFMI